MRSLLPSVVTSGAPAGVTNTTGADVAESDVVADVCLTATRRAV